MIDFVIISILRWSWRLHDGSSAHLGMNSARIGDYCWLLRGYIRIRFHYFSHPHVQGCLRRLQRVGLRLVGTLVLVL